MAEALVQTARFVASYCQYTDAEPTTSTSSHVQLSTKDGTLAGLATVCRYIAQSTSIGSHLLGSTPEAQAQVTEWLTWATTEFTPLMDDKLVKVTDHLQTRTYLVGGSLTLADLVIYGIVHPACAGFPAAQLLHFCNLLRWHDLLQHTADSNGFYPRVTLTKPAYQAPPPPPPPAPKAPAAAAAAPAAKAEPSQPAAVEGAQAPGPKAPVAKPASDAKPADAKPKEKKAPAPTPKKEDEEPRIDMLDIRVGQIVKVGKHPNADSLYLEEIDLGEEKPRQVISGLVNFVPQDQMENRRVLVVCNLKPAKMRDVMSYGMVLCASNDTHDVVVPVSVPEGVPLGERVSVEGYAEAPLDEVNPKKKILERLFPDMKTDESGVPTFKGAKFMTSQGPVTSPVPNAWVK